MFFSALCPKKFLSPSIEMQEQEAAARPRHPPLHHQERHLSPSSSLLPGASAIDEQPIDVERLVIVFSDINSFPCSLFEYMHVLCINLCSCITYADKTLV